MGQLSSATHIGLQSSRICICPDHFGTAVGRPRHNLSPARRNHSGTLLPCSIQCEFLVSALDAGESGDLSRALRGSLNGRAKEVSDRLATAFRLINLTVLPIGSALAAITPTALDIVYGATYVGEALTLSILALSSIFVAQGVLLVTTLQAVGHTRRYLVVTLVSTIAFMGFVGFAALPLGTLSGAIGRALLSILIVALARFSLRHEVSTHIDSALSKAIPLAAGVGLPLLALDQFFLLYHSVRPVFQLVILFGLFAVLYGGISRRLRVFP